MTFVSYAQNFEDILLWRALGENSHGFYIDVGASHPDTDSVTRAFYDRGWSGINIEPVSADFHRLEMARLRDVNLNVALGASPGTGTLFVVPGTGLSTLATDSLSGINHAGFKFHDVSVEIRTLSQICQQHVTGDIHFLKIDVEGSEHAVLSGGDFNLYRPWIIVVEATAPMSTIQTHIEWEHILISAGYQFAWFDGLNRFYIAEEHWRQLSPHFLNPVNVFDDFIRVADTDWAKRIHQAEARAAELAERCAVSERRQAIASESSARYSAEKYLAVQQAAKLFEEKTQAIQNAETLRIDFESQSRASTAALAHLQLEIAGIHKSTSWRITRPIRFIKELILSLRREKMQRDTIEVLKPEGKVSHTVEPLPLVPCSGIAQPGAAFDQRHLRSKRAVHQFHSGSAVADAITNAMLLTRRILRSMGYASEIFVMHRDPMLADELRLFDEIPKDGHYVLIVRHSMGFDGFDEIAALPVSKILIYHNITPSDLLAENPVLQFYSDLGREQLRKLKPLVCAALADSEYNAIELRALGFSPVQTCMLLFDTAKLRRRAMPRLPKDVFTILFVGRLIESKGQRELISAYRRFRTMFDAPSHLVLVGKYDAESDYFKSLRAAADSDELRPHVTLAGMVSGAELDAYYAAADLYVSLSRHEGFGVPLVEAMANGVPVLAWPCGAVPYTLGRDALLLTSREPDAVAVTIQSIAENPNLRARIVRQQYRSLSSFDLEHQKPALKTALAIAGAHVPADAETIALLESNLRFVVTGHFIRSYSLAAVNRTLALAIEQFRPGTIRVVPVDEEKAALASQTPARTRTEILGLAGRAKADCGPVAVISHHYPVHIPTDRGDLLLSLFFWEESVIPEETITLLSENFAGVIAPSRFVAKVLVDSGLSIPICQINYFPDLSVFRQPSVERKQDDVFTFLHVSSCFPRKGVDVLLRAYTQAFGSGDKIRLIIKGFPNPHNDASEQVAGLRAQYPDLAEISVIDEDVDESSLVALYSQADAIVLPTRGEGFNLPAAEALSAGIPLIVTGYGGHMDFCHDQNLRFVDYRFERSGSHFAASHSVWVEPDVDDLASAMMEAVGKGKPPRPGPTELSASAKIEFDPSVALQIKKLEAFAIRTLLTPLNRVSIAWVSTWNVRCGIAGYSKFLIEQIVEFDRIDRLTILADCRTTPQDDRFAVLPCWHLQRPESLASLLKAVTISDADVVVVQHQPGLMAWNMLEVLLGQLRQRKKIVTVTLHNTLHLLEIEDAERTLVLEALAQIARVIVHTISDLNRLKEAGLVSNVVMIPQGAPARLPAIPARVLSVSSVPVIGCYGFFLPGKGIPQLIESLSIVRQKWPGARLRLVNADYGDSTAESEIRACRDLASKAGLQDFIEWHTEFLAGEESLSLLAECDLIALPYQFSKEASSAALRTALCAGSPVMVTPLALFDEAEDAVLRFSGMTSGEIAAGLIQMLGNEKARKQSQQRAELWMQSRSWASIAKRTRGLLLGLAAEQEQDKSYW